MPKAVTVVSFVYGSLLVIYVSLAIVFIFEYGPIADTCQETVDSAHPVWTTSLKGYIQGSAIAFVACFALGFLSPVVDASDALQTSWTRLKKGEPWSDFGDGRPQPRYGVTPRLPDWLFLSTGAFFLFHGLVISIFAYWGYHELYSTDPHCVGFTEYRDIPIWEFGQATLHIQFMVAGGYFSLGFLSLMAPLWLEYVDLSCV